MKTIKLIIGLLLLFSAFGHANTAQSPTVYEDDNGNIYIESPKQFLLIASEPAIPLFVYPHKGLVKLSYSGGRWQREFITSNYFDSVRAGLQRNALLTDRMRWKDIDGDGSRDYVFFTNSASSYDASLLSISTKTGAIRALKLPSNSNLNNDYQLVDVNGDGRLDVKSGSDVFLASANGLFLYAGQGAIEPATKVDTTAGEFRVDETGQATYNVPVALPKGPGGIRPSVAITYSSAAGAGNAGYGWNVAAASAITRCTKNIATDGRQQAVGMRKDDGYCLDGNRLILVSGTYGSANSTYRTELANFMTIKAVGNDGDNTGPKGFIVESKDGDIKYYGDTLLPYDSDAYVKPAGVTKKGAHTWALKQVEDTFGNEITYHYTSNTTYGYHLLSSIAYGKIKVNFDYVDRNTRQHGYAYGGKVANLKRISGIEVTRGGQPYRYYNINGDGSKHDYIDSIQECTSFSADKSCKYALTFQYNKDVSDVGFATAATQSSGLRTTTLLTDFNGDGRSDFIYTNSTGKTLTVRITGSDTDVITSNLKSVNDFKLADVNGDGYTDILYAQTSGSTTKWFAKAYQPATRTLSELDCSDRFDERSIETVRQLRPGLCTPRTREEKLSFSSPVEISPLYNNKGMMVDINGDGLSDWLTNSGRKLGYRKNIEANNAIGRDYGAINYFYEFTANDFPPSRTNQGCAHSYSIASQFTKSADINADGVSDFIVKLTTQYRPINNYAGCPGTNVAHKYKLLLSKGTDEYSKFEYDFSNVDDMRFADLNGDGLVDLVFAKKNAGWQYRLSTGDASTPLQSAKSLSILPAIMATDKYRGNVYFADVNQDSITDIIALNHTQVVLRHGYCHWTGEHDPRMQEVEASALNSQAASSEQHCPPGYVWRPTTYTDGMQATVWTGQTASSSSIAYTVTKVGGGLSGTDHTLKVGDIDGDGLVDILRSSSALTGNASFVHYRNNMLNASVASHKLTKVTNGFGVETDIQYQPLSSQEVYTHLPAFNTLGKVNANFFSPKFGMWLVNSVSSDSNGSGNGTEQVSVEYKYSGFKIDKLGRGPQGFYEIETTDPQTNIKTTTRYHQTWPLTGKPKFTKSYAGDKLITHAKTNWQYHTDKQGALFVYLSQSDEKGWQIGSDGIRRPIKRTIKTNRYDVGLSDKWGNLTGSSILTYTPASNGDDSWNVAHSTTTTNTYYTGSEQLRYGRLKSTAVRQYQYAVNGQSRSDLTRKTEFTYYDNLMLESETVSPECSGVATSRTNSNHCDASNQYTKTYHYDAFGNVKQTDVKAGSQTRSTYTDYNSSGELVIAQSNSQGQTVTYLYNGVTNPDGLIFSTTETSPNGTTKTQRYNQWGEAVETVFSDGTYQKVETLACSGSALCASVNGRYYNKMTQSGVAPQYEVFDKYGRNVRNTKALVDGSTAYEDITYDKDNNPATKTLPYRMGETPQPIRYYFDSYNRIFKTLLPSGKETRVEYLGHITRTIDVGGSNDGYSAATYKRDEKQDVLGRVLYKTDPYSGSNVDTVNRVTFKYNAFGDLVSTANSVYNAANRQFTETITKTHYDRYGRKIKIEDPSRGSWQFYYNGFGEVIKEVNGRTETKSTSYNVLGQVVRTVQLDKATANNALISCLVYGKSQSAHNIGKLTDSYQFRVADSTQSCASLIANATASISKHITFDEHGRPETSITRNSGGEFKSITSYNENGQISQIALPNGMFVKSYYNNGQLVSNYDAMTNKLLSKIDSVDAQGRITKQTFSGGVSRTQAFERDSAFIDSITISNASQTLYTVNYKHDIRGTTRHRISDYYEPGVGGDSFKFTEAFGYENNGLQRLETRSVSHASTRYGVSLRLANQTYSYDDYGNIRSNTNVGTYHYTNSNNPYQLVSVSGATGKRSYSMSYDNHGNITNDGERRFYYTQFDKPYKITKGNTNTEFRYDESGHRYFRKDVQSVNGSVQTKQVYYVGKAYELIKQSGGKDNQGGALPSQIEHRWYVGGVVISQIEGQAQKVQVAHSDMLGSTVLVTNDSGNAIAQYIYDPWGKQQQVYATSEMSGSLLPLTQMRAFTGHEQVEQLDIVHMNGRIYDANLGRFLQADPFVQFPELTQSHNRYSYVLNNPLTYNDPSGYFLKKLMKITGLSSLLKAIAKIPILDAAVSIALGAYAPWALTLYQGLKTYAVTGSFGAALKAMVISDLTIMASTAIGGNLSFDAGGWTAAANVASHAAVGGITSVLQGGKFGHGFVSSLVTTSMKGFMNPQTTNFGNAYTRTAIAGLVGGTLSEITGGKFANGAVTSAMQWWYNAEKGGLVEKHKRAEKTFNDLVERGIREDNSDYHQQALNFAAGYWGIDVEDKGQYFYPNFDGDLRDYGVVENGGVHISLATLQEGLGFTGSTLFHEMVHIKDGIRYSGQFGAETIRLMEINAYDSELKYSKHFGLTSRQVNLLKSNRYSNCVNIHVENRTSRGISC
ncbi:toxin TcdB middle/N-terminal domain-containing protein [Pseudoalteromonas piscicida]|uniref:Insecticide toxin TcdB middle/N-terminal domain-containing protein n=1 Tax=Pseudoalteromonas piscicida TaxID=43662 RepID=A0A2A5JUB3_PSEO7|nr:toxin TcdB middle/N-terminal domain-containing protein [Pseudoalteromonas piscicida]PCK32947.1 hypothetical protein CEX98_04980 [Pseudoalteromonas piscicida]